MRKIYRTIFIELCLIGVLIFITPIFHVKAESENRVVRIGWFEAEGSQSGTDLNSIGGYNYEYLVKIAQYEGWKCEFVFGEWADLEQQLENGEIDILGNVAKTTDRLDQYNYCLYASGDSRMLMVCRPDDTRFAYNDYASFNGIKVGTLPSTYRKQLLDRESKENHFEINYMEYDTNVELLDALNVGETDVAIVSDVTRLENVKIISEWEANPYYFVVNLGEKEILEELNDAMLQIQSSDYSMQERLFEKYFGTDGKNVSVALTRNEMDYVEAAGVLKVLVVANKQPISYIQDGKMKGLVPDYCDKLAKNTGLEFEYIICDSYQDMLDKFQAGKGNISAQLHDDLAVDISQDIYSLKPYYTLNYGLLQDASKLGKAQTVGVEAGDNYMIKSLENSGYQPVLFKDIEECMAQLVDGNIDAALLSNPVYQSLSYHPQYQNLTYTLLPGYCEGLYLGMLKTEDNSLFSTLSKGAGRISDQQIEELMFRNATAPITYSMQDYLSRNATTIFVIILLLIVIGVCVILVIHENRYNGRLSKANIEIEKANARTTAFFSNLSHDMRTPLTGIIGYTDLALEEQPTDQEKNYLQKIKQSSTLLENLINDTLEVSKIRSGKWKVEPTLCSIYEILDVVVVPIESMAEDKLIRVHKKFNVPREELIFVDVLKVQDVLLNLLSNAVKYTPKKGEVWFTVSRELREDQVANYRFEIRDNGIGMSEAFMLKLYEEFEQECDPRLDQVTGTGLGMTIAKQIIEMLKGSINIESVKDKGTICKVEIPFMGSETEYVEHKEDKEKYLNRISQKENGNIESSVQKKKEQLKNLNVLLCEDNPINTEIFKKLLEKQGMSYTCTANGQEGLAAFAQSSENNFQMVLMDLRMPIMDGFTAASRIRALDRKDASTVPIIAISADAFDEDIHKSLQSGMNAHISKPIEPKIFYDTIAEIVIEK